MFNLSGSEVLFILVIGLVVLGPEKLPDMLRRAGRLYGELRRMSQGVQAEFRSALDEPTRELRDATANARSMFGSAGSATIDDTEPRFIPHRSETTSTGDTSSPTTDSSRTSATDEPPSSATDQGSSG